MSIFRGFIKPKEKKSTSQKEKPLFASQPYVGTALVTGNIKELVPLPPFVDEDEWLAVNGSSTHE
jgi:hypothetical protein